MICILQSCNNMQDKTKSAFLLINETFIVKNETFIDLLSTTATHQRCHETTHGTGTGILNPMTAGNFVQTCSLISNR